MLFEQFVGIPFLCLYADGIIVALYRRFFCFFCYLEQQSQQ